MQKQYIINWSLNSIIRRVREQKYENSFTTIKALPLNQTFIYANLIILCVTPLGGNKNNVASHIFLFIIQRIGNQIQNTNTTFMYNEVKNGDLDTDLVIDILNIDFVFQSCLYYLHGTTNLKLSLRNNIRSPSLYLKTFKTLFQIENVKWYEFLQGRNLALQIRYQLLLFISSNFDELSTNYVGKLIGWFIV